MSCSRHAASGCGRSRLPRICGTLGDDDHDARRAHGPLRRPPLPVGPARSSPSSSPPTSSCRTGGRSTRSGSRTSISWPTSSRSQPGWRRHVPAIVFVVAARRARPRPGPTPGDAPRAARRGHRRARHRRVRFDEGRPTSSPPRLAAAKDSAKEFLKIVPPRFQVGVVAFHSTVRVLANPTTDRELASQAIDSMVANGGTAMGDAILTGVGLVRPEAFAGRTRSPVARTAAPSSPILGARSRRRSSCCPTAPTPSVRRSPSTPPRSPAPTTCRCTPWRSAHRRVWR